MEEIAAFLLGNPVFRATIESIAVKVIAEILHRRAADPAFLAKSDMVFAQIAQAKTDEEKDRAARSLSILTGSP